MRRARPLLAVTVALAVLAVVSCREPTEITVDITTDVQCADMKGVTLTVGNLADLDQRPVTTATSACDHARVGALVIVPSGADDDTVSVKIVMGLGKDPADCVPPKYGSGCIVARRALRYIPHAKLTLPVFMSAVCNGIACGATETCVGGNCRPATIADPNSCASPEGCGESTLGPSTTPAPTPTPTSTSTAPPDAGSMPPPVDAGAPCAAGTVCDVVTSTTTLDVAVTASALFWLDSAGKVMISALDGTNAKTLVMGEQAPLAGLEADAQFVYWTANGRLRRAGATTGATPTTLTNIAGGCLKWMVPSSKLLAGAPGAGAVYVYDVGTNTLAQPINGAVAPWGVAGGALDNFFYTNSVSSGAIRHADGVGGVTPTLVGNQSTPRCMATDGASLWWANDGSGTLVKSTIAGTGVQSLVTGQTTITGVALDATYVYWSWQGGIRRHAK